MRCLTLKLVLLMAIFAVLTGCAATYVTPGGAVDFKQIDDRFNLIDDQSIKEKFETRAAATFPASIVVVRVQQSGYESQGAPAYGSGTYSVVLTRDIETDEEFEKLSSMQDVANVGTLNRLLLPERLESIKDLRRSAAGLHADMLLLYTLDTSFRIKGKSYGPFSVITLGFLPNKEAFVTTTASAVFYDVRTGHIYGLSEASHTTSHLASMWSKSRVIDNARIENEKEAFAKLVGQLEKTWDGIVKEYKK